MINNYSYILINSPVQYLEQDGFVLAYLMNYLSYCPRISTHKALETESWAITSRAENCQYQK
jgi:hypothetical protein